MEAGASTRLSAGPTRVRSQEIVKYSPNWFHAETSCDGASLVLLHTVSCIYPLAFVYVFF